MAAWAESKSLCVQEHPLALPVPSGLAASGVAIGGILAAPVLFCELTETSTCCIRHVYPFGDVPRHWREACPTPASQRTTRKKRQVSDRPGYTI